MTSNELLSTGVRTASIVAQGDRAIGIKTPIYEFLREESQGSHSVFSQSQTGREYVFVRDPGNDYF